MIKLKLLGYAMLAVTFSSAALAQEAAVSFKKYDKQKKSRCTDWGAKIYHANVPGCTGKAGALPANDGPGHCGYAGLSTSPKNRTIP